jgi:DNA helicase II / ATP-dependent DNA helicase PcrA
VQGFLESAALLSSLDEGDAKEKLTLMTLHAAKGLEYDVVYVAGLEEHGFPHSRALQDGAGDDLEEERRLAYVGITRARRRLVLSWASQRMVQGVRKPRTPSRFLFEIPREVLEGDLPPRPLSRPDTWREPWREREPERELGNEPWRDPPRARPQLGAPSPTQDTSSTRVEYDEPVPSTPPRRRLVLTDAAFVPDAARGGSAPATDDDGSGGLTAGARVWHRHFGAGVIVGMRGGGKNTAALVRFDDERQPRVIIARHLKADDGSDADEGGAPG